MSEVTTVPVECWNVTGASALDPIHVFWIDVGPGAGYVTIICYGQAWTAYFGGMGGQTIRQFFASCDTSYLVTKMGITPHLRTGPRHELYLGRIIDAVRDSIVAKAEGRS